MKIEVLSIALALIGGLALGIVFYYGLWLTIKFGVRSQNPSLWFLGSFLLRTILALAGFYFISGGSWQQLALCLCGFIVARYTARYFARAIEGNGLKKEISHEAKS